MKQEDDRATGACISSNSTVMADSISAVSRDYYSDDGFNPLQAMANYAPRPGDIRIPRCSAAVSTPTPTPTPTSPWLALIGKPSGVNSELNLNPNSTPMPSIIPQSTSSFLTNPVGFRPSSMTDSLAMNQFLDLAKSSISSSNSSRPFMDNRSFSWGLTDCNLLDKDASNSATLIEAQNQISAMKRTTDYSQSSSPLMAAVNLHSQNPQSLYDEIKPDSSHFIPTGSCSSLLWAQQNQLC
ncbi:hypothetical protein SAY86_016928 [Trapa natans]|uniref:Uncharacterized protein n=1 Tax=Trapa natans TaxID=22666 RepID=A0AAN7LQJ2_TRANT|nr:hypothetical protein SAY86_016928 [Trapa natans]